MKLVEDKRMDVPVRMASVNRFDLVKVFKVSNSQVRKGGQPPLIFDTLLACRQGANPFNVFQELRDELQKAVEKVRTLTTN